MRLKFKKLVSLMLCFALALSLYVPTRAADELTYDYGEIWERAASAKTTLTITEEQKGYTASINTLQDEFSVLLLPQDNNM